MTCYVVLHKVLKFKKLGWKLTKTYHLLGSPITEQLLQHKEVHCVYHQLGGAHNRVALSHPRIPRDALNRSTFLEQADHHS